MAGPIKEQNSTNTTISEVTLTDDSELSNRTFPNRCGVLTQLLTLLPLAFGASCTTPGLSHSEDIRLIEKLEYPELSVIDPDIADAQLIIFVPDQSIKPESIENYRQFVHQLAEELKRDGFDDEMICYLSSKLIDPIREAQILSSVKKISSTTLIVVSFDPQKVDNTYPFTTKVEQYHNLSTIPETAVLEHPCNFRIYVADGAFQQGLKGSLSQWTQLMADSLERRFPELSIDVTALRYTEFRSIRNSAKIMARFLQKDLQDRPLQEDEEIILLGHSQGAFILSYLSKCAEAGEPFTKNLPWNRVKRAISFDLPFKIVEGYEGPCELPVDLVFLIARHDPIVFPLLSDILYPVGNDYLGNTDAYDVIRTAGHKEYRIQRNMLDGSLVNPTVAGSAVDNYENKFEHDPFLASLFLHLFQTRDNNRVIREQLLELILETLPLRFENNYVVEKKE